MNGLNNSVCRQMVDTVVCLCACLRETGHARNRGIVDKVLLLKLAQSVAVCCTMSFEMV